MQPNSHNPRTALSGLEPDPLFAARPTNPDNAARLSPVLCLLPLVTRTNASFMRTMDAFTRTTQLTRPQSSSPVPRMNASFMRTRDAFTRIKQLTCYQPLSMPSVAKRQRIKHMQNSPRGRGGQTRRDNALMRTALDRLVVRELTVDDAGS